MRLMPSSTDVRHGIVRNDRSGYSNSTDTEEIQYHVKDKAPQKSESKEKTISASVYGLSL